MTRRGIIYRFSADIRDINLKITQLEKRFEQLAVKSGRASQAMNRVGASATQAGTRGIEAGVKFQTATQGMLNLTTAAVQTITSLSNLDRAENRAKQAAIALARAEDLLANKKERLSSIIKSGTASEQKQLNIRKEIITATADLQVKTEKLKIEQDAMNDIYALFFTNLLNVGISSIQTVVSLYSLLTLRTISNKTATNANSAATAGNSAAIGTNTGIRRLWSPVIGGNTLQTRINTLALRGTTVAIRVQTIALNALKFALGPIGLILIGITAAMTIWEVATGGVSKALGFAADSSVEFADEVANARDTVGGLGTELDKLSGKLEIKIPKSIGEARKAFALLNRQILLTVSLAERVAVNPHINLNLNNTSIFKGTLTGVGTPTGNVTDFQ